MRVWQTTFGDLQTGRRKPVQQGGMRKEDRGSSFPIENGGSWAQEELNAGINLFADFVTSPHRK